MQNFEQILQEFGIDIPEDKRTDLKKKFEENYRTKADYDKAVSKRDEYKQSLENVQTKLDGFKNVNVDDLKGQITSLTESLEAEKAARAKDAEKAELDKRVGAFMSGKKFVNTLTEKSLRASILEELDKDTARGKSIEDIFTALTTGDDGEPIANILIDSDDEHAQQNRAQFTQPFKNNGNGGKTTKEEFRKMSIEQRIELKKKNPALYENLRKL